MCSCRVQSWEKTDALQPLGQDRRAFDRRAVEHGAGGRGQGLGRAVARTASPGNPEHVARLHGSSTTWRRPVGQQLEIQHDPITFAEILEQEIRRISLKPERSAPCGGKCSSERLRAQRLHRRRCNLAGRCRDANNNGPRGRGASRIAKSATDAFNTPSRGLGQAGGLVGWPGKWPVQMGAGKSSACRQRDHTSASYHPDPEYEWIPTRLQQSDGSAAGDLIWINSRRKRATSRSAMDGRVREFAVTGPQVRRMTPGLGPAGFWTTRPGR